MEAAEMRSLIYSFDWKETPLGAIDKWSSSLKLYVNLLLTSGVPMHVSWGSSGTQVYNDLFRPIMGWERHPAALGKKIDEAHWADFGIDNSVFSRILNGETVTLPDVRIAADRSGLPQDLYFNFSCSPISDEGGDIQGMLIICIETTARISASKELQAYRENIRQVVGQAPVGICILTGSPLRVAEINDFFLRITNKPRSAFFENDGIGALSEHRSAIEQVFHNGEEHKVSEQLLISPGGSGAEPIYADFVYQPVRNATGDITGVVIVANEVTDKVLSRQILQNVNEEIAAANEEMAASNEELMAANELLTATERELQHSLDQLTRSEQQIRQMVENAPFPIAVYIGREMRIVHANWSIMQVWGKGDEVVGKTYHELLPELADQNIYERLDEVYTTGIAFHTRNERVLLNVHGKLTEFYFNYSFTPLLDEAGKVYGVMNTAADVTDLYTAKQKVEHSERNFRNVVLQAPVAMCLLSGPEHIIEVVNDAMIEIWGKSKDQVLGKPVFDALPDAKGQGLESVMTEVYLSGRTFEANEQPVSLIRNGVEEVVYQNFVYHPYYDSQGQIHGVLAISVNVTEQVKARFEVERAYEQARLSKEAAQLGTFDMDMVKGTLEWDVRCRELFGVQHDHAVTYEKDFLEGIHPDDLVRVTTAISHAMDQNASGGDYDIEYRTLGPASGELRWVRAKGKVYFDPPGKPSRFIGSVLDITDEKLLEIKHHEIAEKQGRLAAIVDSSDDAIVSKNLDGIIISWNKSAVQMFGYTEAEAIGKHISLIIPPDRIDEEEYIINHIKAGEKIDHFETIRIDKQGTEKQLSITISPILDANGRIIGASKIARDISAQLAAQLAIKKYTERLEILNTMIEAVSEELDLDKILQKVTDATTELTGAKFGAFFYNRVDDNGESYMLFTLSGAPREAFERFGMPRNTAIFHPTFSGQGVIRVDDITKDPRYGKNLPHYGMPKGHLPVVSYLAVPVISRSGEVIGGLFFGHPEAGVFTQDHESLVTSIAAQAAIGLDNAKLFEEVKALNDKKDEFIALASHELKTPLTSVSGYLQIIGRLREDELSKKFLQKATVQVQRLSRLVSDLLDVSKIEAGKLRLTISEIDLKEIVEDAIELVRPTAENYKITLTANSEKCTAQGDNLRIEQVVLNLLTNAIKYSPGADLVEVFIFCDDTMAKVGVRDYGLGIPADKQQSIFSRFFRIDEATPNISGLGIGLYLAQEIISRHNGQLWVESETQKGSTFWFTLPREGQESKP